MLLKGITKSWNDFVCNDVDEKIVNKKGINDEIVTMKKSFENIKGGFDEDESSDSYKSLINSFLESMERTVNITSEKEFEKAISDLVNNLERIRFLTSISNIKNTAIIVGANGSGKSTFVNSLNGSSLPNLTVIPAQKNLYFSANAYNRTATDTDKYRNEYMKSSNDDYKKNDGIESQTIQRIFEPFTMLLTSIVNEVAQVSTEERNLELNKKTETTWDKINKVWKLMIPEVTFHIDAVNRTLIPVRNNIEYSINELSDGEKCILFYLGNVLLAKKGAYIVVDEPETFLNPAIYNKLWDKLINIRSDCQFIFTSHNVEFISARRDTTIVWCKQFTPPNKITLRPLNINENMPMSLLTELVGSRRRILFCEGTEESYDYQVFSSLFMKEYTVKPVGGHDKVIEYTRVFNELPEWVDNSAIGIIDRDGIDNNRFESLKNTNVVCLPYNEIEMLLLDEKIMKKVLLLNQSADEVERSIATFQNEMFAIVNKKRNEIIYNLTKNEIDSKLRNQFINSTLGRNVSTLKKNVNSLVKNIDVDEISNLYSIQFDTAIRNKDYEKILELSTLKKELSDGLTNEIFRIPYIKFALGRIDKDIDLQRYLRNKLDVK